MDLIRSELEVESIVSRIRRGDLDLQPDFQRGEIWDNKRRQRLIDSLLREWYIPAIHVVRDRQGGPDIVLDGQQRLAAIRDFFDDKFRIDGTIEPSIALIRDLDRMRFSDLPSRIQFNLNRFALPIVTLKDYDPQEPNELFFRLNQSYNLTPSEKRNALHGIARGQVKDLVSDLERSGLLNPGTVGFSNGRLAYDDIVARTCVAIEQRTLRSHINNGVVENYYRDSQFSNSTLATVFGAGRLLKDLCGQLGTRVRFNKATLFSWLIFCSWAPNVVSQMPPDFLDRFESDRRRLKAGTLESSSQYLPSMVGAIGLYDDRASYRVTDVSSVLARDCVLFLYMYWVYDGPGVGMIESLAGDLGRLSDTMAQSQILEFIGNSQWGEFQFAGAL